MASAAPAPANPWSASPPPGLRACRHQGSTAGGQIDIIPTCMAKDLPPGAWRTRNPGGQSSGQRLSKLPGAAQARYWRRRAWAAPAALKERHQARRQKQQPRLWARGSGKAGACQAANRQRPLTALKSSTNHPPSTSRAMHAQLWGRVEQVRFFHEQKRGTETRWDARRDCAWRWQPP